MSSPTIPRSTIIPPLSPQKLKAASSSSASKLVVPTSSATKNSSSKTGSPALQLQKQPMAQEAGPSTPASAASTNLSAGSDSTPPPPPTNISDDAEDTPSAPPTPISTPTITFDSTTIKSLIITTIMEPENDHVVSDSNGDYTQAAPPPPDTVVESSSSPLNQWVNDSNDGFFSMTAPTEMEQRAPAEDDAEKQQEREPLVVSTRLEMGSATSEQSSHICDTVVANEMRPHPESSPSVSESLPQNQEEVMDSNNSNNNNRQETDEAATAAVAALLPAPDDHVLELFSQQLQRLEENHRMEFARLEKDHGQALKQLQQELEWHRTEQGLHGKQVEMLKENFTLQLNRLQTELEEKSQLLQARYVYSVSDSVGRVFVTVNREVPSCACP
jgi:hypothetical protein